VIYKFQGEGSIWLWNLPKLIASSSRRDEMAKVGVDTWLFGWQKGGPMRLGGCLNSLSSQLTQVDHHHWLYKLNWPRPLIYPKLSQYVNLLTLGKKFHGYDAWSCNYSIFEGGSLLNLTPVTKTLQPGLQLHESWLSCNYLYWHQSDLLFHFQGNCVNLHLLTTIRKHVYYTCCPNPNSLIHLGL